ncbi:hypothetical protein CB0940_12119 [Cercospora beticola]|nr:hypothetical protein CB0940_12119 [Cercospora beticola]PIA80036.1 hypothetical protein CB0940_12119 [Cercospora beticola]
MSDTSVAENTVKFPQLVSFIGDTNAGKSTLIKILIRRQHHNGISTSESDFPSPISGSTAHPNTPTTGDVHLYSDPSTSNTPLPMLFADCEGLRGGAFEPSAIQYRKQAESRPDVILPGVAKRAKLRRNLWLRNPRLIKWATSEDRRTREYVVTELYPRLLYTFSDVVVYVLHNPKVFQNVLKKLVAWGAASLEKSLNSPRLPHAILVLNMCSADCSEWEDDATTQSVLNDCGANSGLCGIPHFQALANAWRDSAGEDIQTAHELLLKYYSSFTVVRIPKGEGRFNLLDQQAALLQRVISHRCAESFFAKQKWHMPITADGMNRYLQAGFDHFARTLTEPFDFIKIELENNPPPEDFADHMYAVVLLTRQEQPDRPPEAFLSDIGRVIACCVLLDAEQRDDGPVADLLRGYKPSLKAVFTEFCDRYWPCSFQNRHSQQCRNSRAGHEAKGHQNAAGKPIGTGSHVFGIDITDFENKWFSAIEQRVLDMHDALQSPDDDNSIQAKSRTIRSFLSEAYANMNPKRTTEGLPASYASNTTCLSCLRATPEHALLCGHVLCSGCVAIHGNAQSDCITSLDQCPLHCDDAFPRPWRITMKPLFAGVRVLSLDGGGVRGIVELEVLHAIERELDGSLPVQAFFDLIVGTSTGGIVALALASKQWNLKRCTDAFIMLCSQAFTRRDPEQVPRWLTLAARQSLYKTKPLYQALQVSLGDEPMFGGRRKEQPEFPIKVAVTTHSDIGKGPAIIANYNRAEIEQEEYDFIRSNVPSREMKVYEAAAATSAAPKYFKTFIHAETSRCFVDGALYWNNPAAVAERERQLLWPDKAGAEPDILLSIGTGQNKTAITTKLRDIQTQAGDLAIRIQDQQVLSKLTRKRAKPRKRFRKAIHILAKRFDNMLDTERSWMAFERQVERTRSTWPDRSPLPYFRWNVDLKGRPPKLDAVQELFNLRKTVQKELKTHESRAMAQRIAHQLVASTFYFCKEATTSAAVQSQQTCSGRILCRFENGSRHLRSLGQYLARQNELCILISEENSDNIQKISFKPAQIDDMMAETPVFQPVLLNIPIHNSMAKVFVAIRLAGSHLKKLDYPISGFPRCLLLEDSQSRSGSRRSTSQSDKPKLLDRWNHRRLDELQPDVTLGAFASDNNMLARLAAMRLHAATGFPDLSPSASIQSESPFFVQPAEKYWEEKDDASGGAEDSDSEEEDDYA